MELDLEITAANTEVAKMYGIFATSQSVELLTKRIERFTSIEHIDKL